MPTPARCVEPPSRASRFIAEALVGRHGPRQISTRAAALGLPRPLTSAIIVACSATATDPAVGRRRVISLPQR